MAKKRMPIDPPEMVDSAFYEALSAGDIERLMQFWSDEHEVICINPGCARQVGLEGVRASFEAVFAKGSMRITPLKQMKYEGGQLWVCSVLERHEFIADDGIQTSYVLATHVQVKTAHGWRMLSRHASKASAETAAEHPQPLLRVVH
jgi:ketosteroid isomerase-like protein